MCTLLYVLLFWYQSHFIFIFVLRFTCFDIFNFYFALFFSSSLFILLHCTTFFFVHLVQNAHNFRMANEHFSIRSIEISFFTSFCRRHRSSGELLQLHSLIKPTKENQIHYVFVQRYLLCLLVLWCIIEMPYRRIVDVMSKRP